jgi:hypothetical protein
LLTFRLSIKELRNSIDDLIAAGFRMHQSSSTSSCVLRKAVQFTSLCAALSFITPARLRRFGIEKTRREGITRPGLPPRKPAAAFR